MNKIVAYAKLLRIPGIAALALPPVFGALTVGVYNFHNLAILFGIGAFAAIIGFVLNDYIDVEVDEKVEELRGRPLVSGDITTKSALMLSLFCIFLSFLLIVILWYGKTIDIYKIAALFCVFLAGIFGSIYNIYGKKIVGSDFFVALSVALIFLFGALSFGRPNIITWIVFLLIFNNVLHMNAIQGGIKDAANDSIMGVKNIALYSGVKVKGRNIFIPNSFKAFGMGIRLFTTILLFLPFFVYGYFYYPYQIAVLVILTVLMLFISVQLLTIKEFNRDIIRRYIGIQSFLRYSLVPIMLISIITLQYSIILIFFPLIWYIVVTPLIGAKLFKPRM